MLGLVLHGALQRRPRPSNMRLLASSGVLMPCESPRRMLTAGGEYALKWTPFRSRFFVPTFLFQESKGVDHNAARHNKRMLRAAGWRDFRSLSSSGLLVAVAACGWR